MTIPFSYSWKSLWARKATSVLTAAGMALVVYVFATVLMLTEGLKQTLVATGSEDNVILIRKGAETEVQSTIEREQAAIIESAPEIAYAPNGTKLASKEVMVLMTLPKRGSDKPSNVTIRGLSQKGLTLRTQVRLAEGRMFRPGSSEIVAGKKIAENFKGSGIGETMRFGLRDWTVVGVMDAGNTGFSSEIWGDAEQLMQAFRRTAYSAVVARLADVSLLEPFRDRVEADPRMKVEAQRETEFYAEQSEMLANFLEILGMTLSIIFSLGAIIGAVITMYGAVASRTREIGTLRALGFRRGGILSAFLFESSLLGLIGGFAGVALASTMQFLTVSTLNWQTFSELAFTFTMTPAIACQSLVFSLFMGLAGGLLPALRAARMDLIDALRSV
ncbi:efflux ABC transporter, permease protein [Methylocaldum marinum]|uniref:Efflux ABC transporter, permease protein n=1 Tax=Methylocaldum marinum TaxID=1432792 RepID=A0A250KWD8_9GAMM|nr:ABC transporter permease [Methylocaldum marinum]BBA35970.1 efflux ABC transporter, permease protein [Methylocaldum marinum]